MLLIDSDNAAGSPRGDVDDAFALAALLRSGLPVAAVSSVAGNTGEARADRNNRVLGDLCGYRGPYLRGIQAGDVPDRIDRWTGGPVRFLALGPLTNLAALLDRPVAEAILVGGNLTSKGRFPPWWPHEFNLTKDREATRAVFASELPLTIVPLDVARRLRAGPREMRPLEGPLGDFLRRHSARWSRRSLLRRGSPRFPVFDLVAAIYAIEPLLFASEETRMRLHRNLWTEFGKGNRRVTVIRGFDPGAVWDRFLGLVSGRPAASQAPPAPLPR